MSASDPNSISRPAKPDFEYVNNERVGEGSLTRLTHVGPAKMNLPPAGSC